MNSTNDLTIDDGECTVNYPQMALFEVSELLPRFMECLHAELDDL